MRLPQEEYDWFDIYGEQPQQKSANLFSSGAIRGDSRAKNGHGHEEFDAVLESPDGDSSQKLFFEYAGPLFSVLISPKSSVVPVDRRKKYRVICRDRSRRVVLENLEYQWNIVDGEGRLDKDRQESITFIQGMG